MNDELLKTIPDYIQKLPESVRDFVFDGEWQERTGEIATKYGLSAEQTDILTDKVLYILIGLEQPDAFIESITTELFISKLLAEQIIEDLDNRVFDYAASQIEKAEGGASSPEISKTPAVSQTEQTAEAHTNSGISVPRYAPEPAQPTKVVDEPQHKTSEAPLNLPGIPVEGMLPAPKEIKEEKTQDRIDWSKFAKNTHTNIEAKEPVQQPISVPRITPSNIPPVTPHSAPEPVKPINMADTKLNTATSSAPTPEISSKKYTIDPYREPLE